MAGPSLIQLQKEFRVHWNRGLPAQFVLHFLLYNCLVAKEEVQFIKYPLHPVPFELFLSKLHCFPLSPNYVPAGFQLYNDYSSYFSHIPHYPPLSLQLSRQSGQFHSKSSKGNPNSAEEYLTVANQSKFQFYPPISATLKSLLKED